MTTTHYQSKPLQCTMVQNRAIQLFNVGLNCSYIPEFKEIPTGRHTVIYSGAQTGRLAMSGGISDCHDWE